MRSRLLLNLALLLLLIILALAVFYTSRESKQPGPQQLSELDPGEVTQIELQRKQDEPITLHKRQAGWYMQSPYTVAANDYRIQALLRLLQAEYTGSHDITKLDPTDYGLDQPRATVTYNDTLRIAFGDTEPLSEQRYVRLADRLYLIPDTHYYHTVSPATGYLSHALLPAGKITALQLPQMQLALENGQWQVRPSREDRSADALTELVANWRTAQAIRLESFEAKELPPADIRIELAGRQAPVRFTLEEKDGQPTLLRHDVRLRYVINEDIRQQLLQLPEPVPEPELERSPRSHEETK
ncbi:DUF4340 domain-containing protein [Thiohalophilus thiocyanatoxydans]|uniref:Uncharacterized protein DUF4340 n=1 Tax=Thiohalophilus thiocyanatoxydans TaxID=381308 RepID=A0A4R8J1Q5_9GAMM|nr:DUF4340 domain-containing protein [Thiohalophilus thiocyanatoxydans]TDY04119.1 uncharacterized protein DUF4340 [Thiohalophilus thiocyanatoxydans]